MKLSRSLPLLVGVALCQACTFLVDTLRATDGALVADGGSDAAALDHSAPPEAGSDASTPCPQSVAGRFCDNFDHGVLGYGWTAYNQAAGVLTTLAASSVSPPNGFLLDLSGRSADAGTVTANLEADLPPPVAGAAVVAVECRAVVQTRSPSPPQHLFTLKAGNWGVVMGTTLAQPGSPAPIVLRESAIMPDAGELYNVFPTTALLIPATATTLLLRLRVGEAGCTTASAEVLVNGLLVGKACISPPDLTALRLVLGVAYLPSPRDPWSVVYDDVECTVR